MVKIEVPLNGHIENCVCDLCHEAREFLLVLRGEKSFLNKEEINKP